MKKFVILLILAAAVGAGWYFYDPYIKPHVDGLIAKYGEKFYFIEVKSSSTFDKAIEQITPKQQQRIHDAALTYLADKVGNLDTECRFDAALVDGAGKIKIMPGVLLAS